MAWKGCCDFREAVRGRSGCGAEQVEFWFGTSWWIWVWLRAGEFGFGTSKWNLGLIQTGGIWVWYKKVEFGFGTSRWIWVWLKASEICVWYKQVEFVFGTNRWICVWYKQVNLSLISLGLSVAGSVLVGWKAVLAVLSLEKKSCTRGYSRLPLMRGAGRCLYWRHSTVLLHDPCVSPPPLCSDWPGVAFCLSLCGCSLCVRPAPEMPPGSSAVTLGWAGKQEHPAKSRSGHLLQLLPNPFTLHQGSFAASWEVLVGSTRVRKLFTQLQISRTATTGPALCVGATTSGHSSSGCPKHPPGAQSQSSV